MFKRLSPRFHPCFAHSSSAFRLLHQQEGTALVVVLLVVGIFMFLGAFGSYTTRNELAMARADQNAKQALAYAEAGIHHAWNLLKADAADGFNDELSSGGTGGGLGSLGISTTLEGDTYRFYHLGTEADDGYYVRVEDNFDETSGANNPAADIDSKIKIISWGIVGKAERVVEVTVGGSSKFSMALFGKLFITLSGGSVTDSFDSSVGAYNAGTAGSEGHVRSNGDISLSGGATHVKGNATAGGTVSASGGSSVTGTTTNNAPPITFPSVPVCSPYSSGTGISWVGSGSYDFTTGVLKGSGGANITLANGTYCFYSITLSGGSMLTINGPVKIYLQAKSVLSGGSIANTTHLASNLQIFSSYNNNTDKNGIVLSGGSGAYMVLYAPDTGITFSGGSEVYGSYIAANVTNSGGSDVHYDKALQNLPGDGVQLSNWHEIRD
jgi:hypothetical protein